MTDQEDKSKKASNKPSAWPSPSEMTHMFVKLAKDIKKSSGEIYDNYKTKRQASEVEVAKPAAPVTPVAPVAPVAPISNTNDTTASSPSTTEKHDEKS